MPEPKLIGGDLLFRWFQKEETSKKALYRDIQVAQLREREVLKRRVYQDVHLSPLVGTDPGEARKWYPRKALAKSIGHLGIYVGSGHVIEVGGSGLSKNKVKKRDNTDIVVRFPTKEAWLIEGKALATLDKPHKYAYPRNRVGVWGITNKEQSEEMRQKAQMQTSPYQPLGPSGNPFLLNPYNPLCEKSGMWPELWKKEKEIEEKKMPQFKMEEKPVCSHYAHAILYAALCGGTVRAAISRETMHIFSVSPNVLFHYFLNDMGVFQGNNAVAVGVQHLGQISPDKTIEFILEFSDELGDIHKESMTDTLTLMANAHMLL